MFSVVRPLERGSKGKPGRVTGWRTAHRRQDWAPSQVSLVSGPFGEPTVLGLVAKDDEAPDVGVVLRSEKCSKALCDALELILRFHIGVVAKFVGYQEE